MPAKSKSQQRFFGLLRSIQKGEQSAPNKELAEKADSISPEAVEDFASTKHKKLPNRKDDDNDNEKDSKKEASLAWGDKSSHTSPTRRWVSGGLNFAKTLPSVEQNREKAASVGSRGGAISAFLDDEWVRNQGANGGYASKSASDLSADAPDPSEAPVPNPLTASMLQASMFTEQLLDGGRAQHGGAKTKRAQAPAQAPAMPTGQQQQALANLYRYIMPAGGSPPQVQQPAATKPTAAPGDAVRGTPLPNVIGRFGPVRVDGTFDGGNAGQSVAAEGVMKRGAAGV